MILDETLQHLTSNGQVSGKRIQHVHLTSYFNVIQLNDGSVGACANYCNLPSQEMKQLRAQITNMLVDDPLLLQWLFRDGAPPSRIDGSCEQATRLAQSLRATVLNALSAGLLQAGGDASFTVSASCPTDPFAHARRALVIGFGGYMGSLARAESITELHVSDLGYGDRSAEMDAVISKYRQDNPRKQITVSDGHDTIQWLHKADVVTITGSALCNDSLDDLLHQARGVPQIVVQGQSAGIHPAALFQRGVKLVTTTLKPTKLVQLAAIGTNGDAMKPLLENGLPPLYCVPRGRD